MKKRMTAIMLALSLILLAFPVHVQARYLNVSSIDTSLKYNGAIATCAADVVGVTGTTKITITLSIQKKESDGSYTTIKEWLPESVNSDMFYLSKAYAVLSGNSYRTYVVAEVTRNGITETVTSYSGTVKCP